MLVRACYGKEYDVTGEGVHWRYGSIFLRNALGLAAEINATQYSSSTGQRSKSRHGLLIKG